MLLFSLSLSLQSVINPHYHILFIISSFCLITNQNRIDYKKTNIPLIILIDRFNFIPMLQTDLSSSLSKSTFAFGTSSNRTSNSRENIYVTKSIICLNEKNVNQNANDIDEDLPKEKKFLHRLIQSSTNIIPKDLYSSIDRENPFRNNRAIRIESALMTNDSSHFLSHSIIPGSRPLIDENMNRTIALIKHNGAGDENLSSHFNDKQVQTPIIMDHNHYLTLEEVPIRNRGKIQFTSKQLILISISIFVCVTLLCLITILFIF